MEKKITANSSNFKANHKETRKEKQASTVLKSSTSDLRTIFCKTSVQNMELNYYITGNDLMELIDHFQIGIVMFKDYIHPKEHFKDGDKCFMSDCNLYLTKEKHMFGYCKYFMILGYFDNMHYDIFYDQESK